jgi:hypothetical protein
MSVTLKKLKALNRLLDEKIKEEQEKKSKKSQESKPSSTSTNKSQDEVLEIEIEIESPTVEAPKKEEKKVELEPIVKETKTKTRSQALKAAIPSQALDRIKTKGRRPVKDVVNVPDSALVGKLVTELLTHLKIDRASEPVRSRNLIRLVELYAKLSIDKKAPNIKEIFIYKAMNISGIGLKDDDFGEIREGKYVQVIAITYEPGKDGKKKAKNVSLGYFGKAETLDEQKKNDVIEFVLRWRYEKAFQNLEHYRMLLERINKKR